MGLFVGIWMNMGVGMGAMFGADSVQITPEVLAVISELDEFKGAWRALGTLPAERLDSLRLAALADNASATNRMEGGALTERAIARLLAVPLRPAMLSREAQYAAGYAATLEETCRDAADLEIDEETIRQTYRDLLRYCDNDAWHQGDYKRSPNHVNAYDRNGRMTGVALPAATPMETPALVAELVAWFKETRATRQLHPVLMVAMFMGALLAIRPFPDGNGRLARVLASALLLQFGYAYVPYGALDAALAQDKDGAGVALRRTLATLSGNTPDWQPWLSAFLRALQRQKRRLAETLERERLMAATLPRLSAQIVTAVHEHGRVTMGDMIRLTRVSRNTLKGHFRRLVRRGELARRGEGKGTWYGVG